MVIGHKSDMTHERVISYGDGERFASANGLSFLETSASESSVNSINDDLPWQQSAVATQFQELVGLLAITSNQPTCNWMLIFIEHWTFHFATFTFHMNLSDFVQNGHVRSNHGGEVTSNLMKLTQWILFLMPCDVLSIFFSHRRKCRFSILNNSQTNLCNVGGWQIDNIRGLGWH